MHYALWVQSSNDYWLGVIYGDLGDVYCDKKEYESALTYYNQSLSIYKKLDNVDFDKAECQYNMAIAHFGLKDYEECKKDFLLAHQICESMSNKSELTEKLIQSYGEIHIKAKDDIKIYSGRFCIVTSEHSMLLNQSGTDKCI